MSHVYVIALAYLLNHIMHSHYVIMQFYEPIILLLYCEVDVKKSHYCEYIW